MTFTQALAIVREKNKKDLLTKVQAELLAQVDTRLSEGMPLDHFEELAILAIAKL